MKKRYITPVLTTVVVAPAAMIVSTVYQINDKGDYLELQMGVLDEASIDEAV